MNGNSIRNHIVDALLSEAIYTYAFDVTAGIVEEEIISRDGINYTKRMGLTVPYHFDVVSTDSLLQGMEVTYASPVDRNERITQKLLLAAYEGGIKKVENVIHYGKKDKYLKLTYYLWKSPEDGHIWTLSACEDITEGWKKSKFAADEARKKLLENERHRLEQLNRALQDQTKMIKGLSNTVISAFQADLRTGEFIIAKVNDFGAQFSKSTMDIRTAFEHYIPSGVHPDDNEKMHLFTDIDTLAYRLKDADIIDLIFHSSVAEREWERARWVVTERDTNGNAIAALFVVEDFTETVRRRDAQRLELEEQYKLEQLRIQTMMEAIHGGFKIGRNDPTFSFITISEQLAEMLGYDSPEEMMEASGGAMIGIANNEDAALAMPDALQSVVEGKMYTMHYRMRCKDGGWKNVEDRGRLIRKPNGEEEYWSFIIDQDELTLKSEALAEAERAKAEILAMNAIAETASRDVEDQFLLNVKQKSSTTIKVRGRLVPAEKRNSRPYDETWKWYIEKYVHADDREDLQKAVELSHVLEGLERVEEYHHRFRALMGDDYHYSQLTYSYVGERGSDLILFGFRNIDRLIREEQEQIRKIEELNDQLEEANKAKTSFLFNMSHDIRTPMNAILGYSRLMKKEMTDPKLLHYQEKMEQASEFLLSLINNVLDMARIESGKMEVDNDVVHPDDVVEEMFSVFETAAREKGLDFSYTTEVETPYLLADSLKIKEIYNNLISNSIKYTPSGGSVTVSAREIGGAPDGYVNIETVFKDTGIGMSREFLEHIFDEFTREQNTTESKISGTGLGMAIVKRLVDLLGGTITIESELGKGTRTIVIIPHKITDESCYKAKTGLYESSADSVQKLAGKHVLLAEDNELNAEIAIAILEEVGIVVDWVEDGSLCIDKITHSPAGTYDLILMDIQMPVMNGYKATKAIRGLDDAAKANIPIIAMTANAFESDRQNVFKAGMNGHVAKPIDINALLSTISQSYT